MKAQIISPGSKIRWLLVETGGAKIALKPNKRSIAVDVVIDEAMPYTVISETEVPDDMVEKAVAQLRTKFELDQLAVQLKEILR